MSATAHLDFDLLDKVAVEFLSGADCRLSAIPERLGPMIELEWLRSRGINLPSLIDLPHNRRTRAFLCALEAEDIVSVSTDNQVAGFIRTLWTHDEDDQRFYRFCSLAQTAAERAGIARSYAQQLVGAIGELEDNIHLHSGLPSSGLLAFCAKDRAFEFAIADRGMGVLKSLQTGDTNMAISDHGAALDAAVRHGVSRYGPGTGHGNGFRPLFAGLYNLNSLLRFRSGDFALTMDGRIGQEKAELFRVVDCPGFVISVFCRP